VFEFGAPGHPVVGVYFDEPLGHRRPRANLQPHPATANITKRIRRKTRKPILFHSSLLLWFSILICGRDAVSPLRSGRRPHPLGEGRAARGSGRADCGEEQFRVREPAARLVAPGDIDPRGRSGTALSADRHVPVPFKRHHALTLPGSGADGTRPTGRLPGSGAHPQSQCSQTLSLSNGGTSPPQWAPSRYGGPGRGYRRTPAFRVRRWYAARWVRLHRCRVSLDLGRHRGRYDRRRRQRGRRHTDSVTDRGHANRRKPAGAKRAIGQSRR
jgi:hypothetical protein